MIKMKSDRPLLVGGVALTEFETDEQHARELESAGLAVRDPDAAAPAAGTIGPDAEAQSKEVALPIAPLNSAAAPNAKVKKAK